ncbi:zinc finger protein Xfin [Betta splendens]|uniref:Zinc finger protein Xfin n=1 Tax=Betta splendens TaxID=158456 RepID=A0A6P7KYI8_BETSP|nr:zinc finger protein Xfin [Betta splendens]XP_028985704.1 zinc finger protein Xfin [Betta splendens]XP_040923897.1 zinc finger protein Xfin [Betta splendens]
MPPAQRQMIMEKQKSLNSAASSQLRGESNTFICTECGDGFSKYSNVLTHMAIHGPLESFSFDGSSNGFEVSREYVLQENGTLIIVNGLVQSLSSVTPVSPEVLPSNFPSPIKPASPNLTPQPTSQREVLRSRPSEFNLDKSRQGHYHCEICSRSFNNLQSLHRHQQYRNTERGYKCTLCCKIFEGRQDLRRHLEDHANERFHCCSHCGKRFLKLDALNSHQKENHLSSMTLSKSETTSERLFDKVYPCKKCSLNFFWMSDFQTHSLYHCKGKEPDAILESEMEIEENSKYIENTTLENCHSNGSYVEPENGNSKIIENNRCEIVTDTCFTPYRCGLCGDRFQKLTALKEHHLTHQTQEEIDQLHLESEKTLKRRIPPRGKRRRGSNPNGKLHPCKHCHRVFNHSSSLSRHMRYHKGTMHKCGFCGRQFPQRCDLRRHLAMYHKAELEKKPGLKLLYLAPKKRRNSSSLNGEKCPSSPDEKTNSSSDKKLSSTAQEPQGKPSGKVGRVNYKCQACGKRFGLLCVYQRHLRYHKKEPSKCPQCPAQFRNSSSLELHLQNHLNTEDADDAGQMSQSTGANEDPLLELGNMKNIQDDYLDHTQNDKGTSSEILYECSECTETFSCLEIFLQHQTSHGSENK